MSDEDTEETEAEEGAGPEPSAVPAPRENAILIGHEGAEAALLASYRSGRLPHAWLFTGPRGVGKATLAFRFARFLLAAKARETGGLFAGVPATTGLAIAPDHPVFRRVASGGHPDLLVVERGYDPKRHRMRTVILAEDARAIPGFLRLTPAEGGWRVVIVDGADTLNRFSANALLKILEEPPRQSVLLLVSDNPGRLPATIRSRCRRLALKALADDQVAAALASYRPDLGREDAPLLARLAEGSIGRALALASAGGVALYQNIFNLLEHLPELEGEALNGLAERVSRGDGADGFALLAELLPAWIARMVALNAGGGEAAILPGEAAAMRRLAGRRSLDQWVEVWENLTHLFAEADSINLDRKQVVLNAFFALEAAAR
jgi:DNA polymerase III subunit delta'